MVAVLSGCGPLRAAVAVGCVLGVEGKYSETSNQAMPYMRMTPPPPARSQRSGIPPIVGSPGRSSHHRERGDCGACGWLMASLRPSQGSWQYPYAENKGSVAV